MPEQNEKTEHPDIEMTSGQKLQVLKATCVQEALLEVMMDQRAEILKRARAKLSVLGITVTDEELAKS